MRCKTLIETRSTPTAPRPETDSDILRGIRGLLTALVLLWVGTLFLVGVGGFWTVKHIERTQECIVSGTVLRGDC